MVSRCVGPDSAPSPQPDVFRPLSFTDGAIVPRRPYIVVRVPHAPVSRIFQARAVAFGKRLSSQKLSPKTAFVVQQMHAANMKQYTQEQANNDSK